MEVANINPWYWVSIASIGVIVSGFGYYPVLLVMDTLIGNMGYNAYCSTRECVHMSNQLLCLSWIPAVGMGAICGLAGAIAVESSIGSVLVSLGLVSGKKKYGVWIGAVIGGLAAAILVAIVEIFVNFNLSG